MIGKRVGSYRILEKLGQGGMGEVYKAEDSRLKRLVAIKVLRNDRIVDNDGRLRFLQEARAASALNHPNIVQIYELESQDADDYIVMELVTGRTLEQVLSNQALGIELALDYAGQIASALAAAHAAGIVHRDIKPANIIVNQSGVLKILDFGLAKWEPVAQPDDATQSMGPETATGSVIGTPCYMSPEQALGQTVNARSDIFSTGAVFYELFTGHRAFDGESVASILSRVLRDQPREIRELRADVPPAVARIVNRCLEKDPALRYASGRELAEDLIECRRPPRVAAFTLRARVLAGLALIFAAAAAVWFYYGYRRAQWARNEAAPMIQSLIGQSKPFEAHDLTRTALRFAPDDPQLKQHWSNISLLLTMTTTPPGALVSYRPYGRADLPWQLVGRTPIETVRTPAGFAHLRLEMDGMETAEFATFTLSLQGQNIPLFPAGRIPAGMVPVPALAPWTGPSDVMPLPDFFLDKFEVTNAQFQQFIEAGGYRSAKYWRYPFTRDGQTIPLLDALKLFHDSTGRPGPAGWELGAFPKEHATFPASGVSWYEAAAFCEYAGKALPTIHHWRKAAGSYSLFSDILLFSNFGNSGPSRAGAHPGITQFGAYDMAGNVKEWCQNDAGGRRAILGGAWNDPSYRFMDSDAQDPFTRSATYGFRCASYPVPVPSASLEPVHGPTRDYSTEKPVNDATFEIFRRMYAYDKTPLSVQTESVDDSNLAWRKETVTYTAAYGRERIPAYLFLPKNAKPPYQTVLYVPGGDARVLRSIQTGGRTNDFDFLMRTGRAVLYPVYKGTFERRSEGGTSGPNALRDWITLFAKDVSRSVDFLESRADIQRNGLAYYGVSMGASWGTLFLAVEPRIKTGILVAGGLLASKVSPEVDPLNFAPRVRVPILMLNGRFDFQAPYDGVQRPLFRFLGSLPADKQHVLFETGHLPSVQDRMREALNWLDRYLGPVTVVNPDSVRPQ